MVWYAKDRRGKGGKGNGIKQKERKRKEWTRNALLISKRKGNQKGRKGNERKWKERKEKEYKQRERKSKGTEGRRGDGGMLKKSALNLTVLKENSRFISGNLIIELMESKDSNE